eukprot:4414060-Pyramimonas_sp.AAC.1
MSVLTKGRRRSLPPGTQRRAPAPPCPPALAAPAAHEQHANTRRRPHVPMMFTPPGTRTTRKHSASSTRADDVHTTGYPNNTQTLGVIHTCR